MEIRVRRVCGIWHGTIDEHPDVDERGLTEEIARRKVEAVAQRIGTDDPPKTQGALRKRTRGVS